jgi:hypothetical protein
MESLRTSEFTTAMVTVGPPLGRNPFDSLLRPNKDLFSFYFMGISMAFPFGDKGSQRKRYMDASVGNLIKLRKLPSKYP